MARPMVFISHVSAESEIAARLKDHLESDFGGGVDFFFSFKGVSIEAGAQWLEEVGKALRRACVEIVLCSPASVERPWIHFEAGSGWILGKPLIPVCHSGILPANLPIPLNLLQGVVVSDEEGLHVLYRSLANRAGVKEPKARFRRIAGEFRELEKKLVNVTKPGGPREALPPLLAQVKGLAARRGDRDLLLHTFLGQEPEPVELKEEAALSDRDCVFRLWADAGGDNHIQASLDASGGPRRVRIRFLNQPGTLPGDVTIRPLGRRAIAVPAGCRSLLFDVRAPRSGQGNAERASRNERLAVSVRVADARATQWCFQRQSDIRDAFEVPVSDDWSRVEVDLADGWVLFSADGNHRYAADRPDLSVIGAVVFEVGTLAAPRLGPGAGEIEIARIRFGAAVPAGG